MLPGARSGVRAFSSFISQLKNPGFHDKKPYNYKPPPNYDWVVFPEKPKLKILEKTPDFTYIRPRKMTKRLIDIRGPEELQNELIHKQYGVQILRGGYLSFRHVERIRLLVNKFVGDGQRFFAVWRIDAPWKPITARSKGKRMGGGKGPISEYVVPVKADRILLEIGGRCEYSNVERLLKTLASTLPMKGRPVSYEMLMKEREDIELVERNNLNKFTMEFCIKNNIAGCHEWLSRYEYEWKGKYL